MKKITLLLFLCAFAGGKVYSQFSATLSGNPLVTTGWSIGGFGTVVDSTVRLTTAGTTENGYVYYGTPVNLTTCAQFTVKFDYQIVPSGGAGIADGIAFFYISNPPSGFIVGGGLGLPNPVTGMVFTLDTWDNDGDGLNPESELYGYSTPSTYDESNRSQLITGIDGHLNTMDNGAWHHCEIDYNAGAINVYYDYSATPGMTGFYLITIPSGYFGFSASTGAGYSKQSVKNVSITATEESLTPGITSSPLVYCQYSAAAPLTATGAGPFHWFTTDTATVTSLPGVPVPVTTVLDTVTYYVREGSGTCISPPDSVTVIISPLPAAPVVAGDTVYCTGATFVPYTATGTGVKWYNVPTGGTGSATPTAVSTTTAGGHTFYASQTVNGCEGPRSSIHIEVYTTPPTPTLTSSTTEYCQYASFIPLTVTGVNVLWYNTPTGGTGATTAPIINTSVPGTYNNYVTQTDSGCTSPRGSIPVVVHPQPAHPAVHPQPWCQFLTASPVSASLSSTGDHLLWYGPGVTAATSTAPTPSTSVAPDTIKYYVTETSPFGCVSDSATDAEIIIKRPVPPVATDVSYCQKGNIPLALNAEVDSAANSYLKWYFNGTLLAGTPVPPTDTIPGTTTWYVTQTVNTCESDSVAVNVTIIYTPLFGITVSQPWVCQFDSISLHYNGPGLVGPSYMWTLPEGASFASGSHVYDSSVVIVFDSAVTNNYVKLTATNDSGKCPADTTVRIKVVTQPTAQVYAKADVCLGDTVSLALSARADDASTYTWSIDDVALASSPAISIVQEDNNSGGPFRISWVDSGRHIIAIRSYSEEGCRSMLAYDTVNVHMIPDANFKIASTTQSGCLEDTVEFAANVADYNNNYQWGPAHSFENVGKPTAWGRIEEAHTVITLTVTDPFGCAATQSMELEPNSCCTVFVPSAFTPNGDALNDFFRPLYYGYHKFHEFRVVNRWGLTVFESENSGMQWDGNFNGVPQDMGTYFYYLKFDCGGKTVEQKGNVTLIR